MRTVALVGMNGSIDFTQMESCASCRQFHC
jgi:hypothetical protein